MGRGVTELEAGRFVVRRHGDVVRPCAQPSVSGGEQSSAGESAAAKRPSRAPHCSGRAWRSSQPRGVSGAAALGVWITWFAILPQRLILPNATLTANLLDVCRAPQQKPQRLNDCKLPPQPQLVRFRFQAVGNASASRHRRYAPGRPQPPSGPPRPCCTCRRGPASRLGNNNTRRSSASEAVWLVVLVVGHQSA